MTPLRSKIVATLGMSLAVGLLLPEPAEARRGGSFGSRGARTYSQPRTTETSPGYVAPVQRSMTPPPAGAPGAQPGGAYAPRPGQPGYAAPAPRPGFGSGFGGFGGGLLGGLLVGGLIGGLMGHGWGGLGSASGLLTMLIQIAVIGLGAFLLMRLFRRRRADALMSGDSTQAAYGSPQGFGGGGLGSMGGRMGGMAMPGAAAKPAAESAWEIPITAQDQTDFERLLTEVQDAFGREDYAALRERSTPEIMSYLAEELSDNATQGRRNEVTGTRLLQADVGEAWQEGDTDYATAALRYEGIDLMRDRTTGAILSGDPDRPSQTVETWTFARQAGGPWKLSAIQTN